jgi:DNA-binding NarL/FixJ family response regulator
MKTIRVLYVEDDPTLLGIVSKLLEQQPELQLVCVSDSQSALSKLEGQVFQAALLDISLGSDSMSGIELAHQIRRRNSEIGIVFFSQYAESARPNTQSDYYMGWSTIAKSGQLDADYITHVLLDAAIGKSHNVEVEEPMRQMPAELVQSLSPKQLQIMGYLSQGYDTTKTAIALKLAPITVRAELTKIYKILVPTPEPGTDLRTTAVLRYLRAQAHSGRPGND